MDSAWYERTVSSFPLSIGTALAFESIFKGSLPVYDPQREIPDRIKISEYSVLYINIQTLIRNILGSVPKEVWERAKTADVAQILSEEKDVIESLLKNEAKDTTRAIFYYNDYNKIKTIQNNPVIYLRQANTEQQKKIAEILNKVSEIFLAQFKNDVFVRKFSGNIMPTAAAVGLMLTHVPYDLTSYSYFKRLDLLESHTGKLKNRSVWYTKFYPLGASDLSYIPFQRRFLYVFGDHVLFSPWSTKLRKQIYEIAQKYQWNYQTTEDKIRLNLDISLKDRFLFDTLMSL